MSVYNISGTELQAVYNIGGELLNQAFDIDGNELLSGVPTYQMSVLHSEPISTGQSVQGMAVYGNYIFQFFTGTNKMKVYSLSDYSYITEFSCTVIGHGNNLQFGDTVQANGFPLLYASDAGQTAGDNQVIYVVSIDLTGCELVDTITLPSSAGYFLNSVIDFDERIIYTVGYSLNDHEDQTGMTVITAVDLDDPTTVIDTWQYNYLGVIQGVVLHNDYIVVNCSTWNVAGFTLYFINRRTKALDSTQEFYKEADAETQGFAFIRNHYLVSKWVYKTVSGTRTLFYEFLSMHP